MSEKASAMDSNAATVARGGGNLETCSAHGVYVATCLNRDGAIKWREVIDNVVCTEGKNLCLDVLLNGADYTVTGAYMGLISSVSFTQVQASDTAAQINGSNQWREAGIGSDFPLYTAPRKICVWSAAASGAKQLSSPLSFSIVTTGGTVEGCFIILGSGATSSIGDSAGVLWSAGVFSSGAKSVGPGDSIQISYSTSL